MKLSPNFWLSEATRSSAHPRFNEQNKREALEVLPKLVIGAMIMEEIRFVLGVPIEIHSWFRGEGLNDAVGGVPTSQHRLGEAIDWSPAGPDTYQTIEDAVGKAVAQLRAAKIMFGQIIVEHGSIHSKKHWAHLSLGHPFRDLEDCREVWRMEAGVYTQLKTLDRSAWRMV